MGRYRVRIQLLLLCVLLCLSLGVCADQGDPSTVVDSDYAVDRRIEDFTLHDYLGQPRSLDDWAEHPVMVVVFIGVDCPLAKLYGPRLAELYDEFAPQGVAFLAVGSNRQDSLTELLNFARLHGWAFPVFNDPGNVVADTFGAARTPEAFVLDAQRVIRYRGRIDDQYGFADGVGYQRAAPQRRDLALAIEQVLAGEPVAEPLTRAVGCLIGRERPVHEDAPVTWSNQIVRIFQHRCQECHRPGQIAPFSLINYEDVLGWEAMIREVVEHQRMPPWGADPHYGTFANDMRLSDEEKQLIYDWVDHGAPEGDPADLPPPRTFSDGWQIPEPHQVVYMSEQPFTVPADGVVEYQWFYVDTGFEEDKWVMAAECRPGNAAVVHHVTVYYKPPGGNWDLRLNDRINLLCGYTPGKTPVNSPYQGACFFLPAGTELAFEMHYTPIGTVQQDRSMIGLVFADPATVTKQVTCVMAANTEFVIPPGEPNHIVQSSYTFDEDSLIYCLTPHMHLRGRSFRFEALYPDGRREILLNVPRFDFNWQTNYALDRALRVPKGTEIRCTARFDNSADNPLNPDPTATVYWGDQTWEEMMIGTLAVAPADQDLSREAPRIYINRRSPWIAVSLLAGVLMAGGGAVAAARRIVRRRQHAVIIAACLAGLMAGSTAADDTARLSVDDIALRDIHGNQLNLSDVADNPILVVAFLGCECPLARLYAPRLAELYDEFAPRGVGFVGINSNRQDTLSKIEHFARAHKLPFPLLKDQGNAAADRFGASRTPEVFVLDRDRVIRYQGRIDDQRGFDDRRAFERPEPGERYLADALEDLLAEEPVRRPKTEPVGCLIGRHREPQPDSPVTWSNQIVRIVQAHCQHCHRPGEIGPFPLLTYEDALGWEGMIAEVVSEGRMPPWHADPHYGTFANDARLRDEEKEQILTWAAHGAPEGDPADLPPPREFPDGWQIREPDHVINMADEPFNVPAEGIVEYQYFVVDPGFKEGRWVQAAECRPGNRAVVHHINVFILRPEMANSWTREGLTNELFWGYAPGISANQLPRGMARYLPPGSQLVFQMHYTPNGTLQQDRSCLGLVFAEPDDVRREVRAVLAVNSLFEIPPGAADHLVQSWYDFDQEAILVSLTPHMHLRGKSFEYIAHYPNGSRETLLHVPRYDFNWQNDYVLAEPRVIPQGTRVQCVAYFDNSADNPSNPDPTAKVTWGDQTFDEMMIGYLHIAVPKPKAHVAAASDARPFPWTPIGAGTIVLVAGLAAWFARFRSLKPARTQTADAQGV